MKLLNTKLDGKTRKINGMDYLPWNTCLITLQQEYKNEKIRFGVEDYNGYPARYNPKGEQPFVRVWLQIGDDRHTIDHPVFEGFVGIPNPDSFQIHTAIQRGFVKLAAMMTGLGLYLWDKEAEIPEREAVLTAFSAAVVKLGSAQDVLKILGITEKEMKKLEGPDLIPILAKLDEINLPDVKDDIEGWPTPVGADCPSFPVSLLMPDEKSTSGNRLIHVDPSNDNPFEEKKPAFPPEDLPF